MGMDVSSITGLAGAIVFLAIIAVAIINGDKTAKIITESGKAFANAITSATHPQQATK